MKKLLSKERQKLLVAGVVGFAIAYWGRAYVDSLFATLTGFVTPAVAAPAATAHFVQFG